MSAISDAQLVLEAAEAKLRDIAKDALSRGDYSVVTTVTALAKSVSELCLTCDADGRSIGKIRASSENSDDAAEALIASRRDTSVHETSSGYPKFQRNGKRLVKLGWSSRDNQIYEQRAPFEIISEICSRLAEKASNKRVLKIEKLLPMKTQGGDDIPSYQIYLVLKWLQQNGVVERQGKEGYLLSEPDFSLKVLWEKTAAL